MVLILFYYFFILFFAAGGLFDEVHKKEMDISIYVILVIVFPIMFPFILGEYIADKTNFF